MGCLRTGRATTSMQMHTNVQPPLVEGMEWTVRCEPMGMEPIDLVWYGPTGSALKTTENGRVAHGAILGECRVVATDALGQRADATIRLQPSLASACVIKEYRTTPASSDVARDGRVEVVGHGLDNVDVLWTGGVRTRGRVLSDVPAGEYAAHPTSAHPIVHLCAPAVVGVRPLSE